MTTKRNRRIDTEARKRAHKYDLYQDATEFITETDTFLTITGELRRARWLVHRLRDEIKV
jgi:hypothetical protein